MKEPAFPTGAQDMWAPKPGMTLRDYFAAKAMQSLIVAYQESRDDNAVEAYRMADAMLKVRESQEAPHTPQEDRP